MAGEDDIIQRISLLGSEEIRTELNQLGDDGAAALKKIESAGGGDLAKGVRALMPEVAKFEQSMSNAGQSAAKLPGIFSQIKASLSGLSFGSKIAADAETATKGTNNLGSSVKGLGRDIRALGRVTDLAGLGQFGRSLSLVGRNIGLIAFPALIAGLGAVADSAASAVSHVLDLAAGIAQTPAAFARAASVVIALGGSFDDAAKSFGTFEKNIATGVASANQAAEAIISAREAVEGARDSFLDATKAFKPLNLEQIKLSQSFLAGKATLEQYVEANDKLNDSFTQTRERVSKAGDAIDRAQKVLDKARAATTPLEDAFRKVGITLSESFQKLPIDEQLKRIAPGFANLDKSVDKTKIAVQLLGEELGRKFVFALQGGTKGLAEFFAEGERIRPALLSQSKTADEFVITLGKLQSALASLKDAFGIALAPAFTDFFKQLIDIVVKNREGFAEFGKALGSIVGPLLEGFLIIIKAVIAAVKALVPVFDLVAKGINKVFGSNLSGGQVFLAIVLGLIGAFAGIIPLIVLAAVAISRLVTELAKIDFRPILASAQGVWSNLVNGFNTVIKFIVDGFLGGVQLIVDAWNGTVAFFQAIWDGIVSGAVGIWTAITDAFTAGAKFIKDAFFGAIQFVKDAFASFLAYIQSWVTSGIQFLQSLVNKIKELVSAITGVNNASAGGDASKQQSFAGGGSVTGPGTGTSDSIVARVSNGEYVVKAAAVQKYGLQLFHALNSMRAPIGNMMRGFSMGGLVDALSPIRSVPRFAEGGSVGVNQRSSFTLQVGGESFTGLSAPQDTAERMVKFATVRSIRRTGARPNWFGNGR